ncbi:MAG: glycosyltransferase family 4 protein [Cyclobacteriaceae bacterium]
MQKQSYELISIYKRKFGCKVIAYKSEYPTPLFFIALIPWIAITLILNPNIKTIHANEGLVALFLTPFLLWPRIRLSTTIHGLDAVFQVAPYQWWFRNLLRKFWHIIAVSKETRSLCMDAGIPADRVTFIANACDFNDPQELDKQFPDWISSKLNKDLGNYHLLVSIGRPVVRKGFSWFARHVLPQLRDNVLYLIVGPETQTSKTLTFLKRMLPKRMFWLFCQFAGIPTDFFELQELARKDDRLILLGKLEQKWLDQLLMHCDLFVMPNLKIPGDFEGFGLVAQEAVVKGALCLAAEVDGIPSAIQNDQNGLLIEVGNAEVWVKNIQELLDNPDRRIEMKSRFSQHLRESGYSWEQMVDRHHQLFTS